MFNGSVQQPTPQVGHTVSYAYTEPTPLPPEVCGKGLLQAGGGGAETQLVVLSWVFVPHQCGPRQRCSHCGKGPILKPGQRVDQSPELLCRREALLSKHTGNTETCMPAHVHKHTRMNTCTNTHAQTHMHQNTHVEKYTHACSHTHVIHVHTHAQTHRHMH